MSKKHDKFDIRDIDRPKLKTKRTYTSSDSSSGEETPEEIFESEDDYDEGIDDDDDTYTEECKCSLTCECDYFDCIQPPVFTQETQYCLCNKLYENDPDALLYFTDHYYSFEKLKEFLHHLNYDLQLYLHINVQHKTLVATLNTILKSLNNGDPFKYINSNWPQIDLDQSNT